MVLTSFWPGSPDKRGLDFESLRASNEGLIFCSITAYGSKGPKKNAPGYDPVLQAETGLMSMTGHPDGAPARVGVGVIDLGTGMWAAVGIQAALRNRTESGVGALVEVSLFETATWALSYHVEGYLATGVTPHRQGKERRSSPPMRSSPRPTAISWSRPGRQPLRQVVPGPRSSRAPGGSGLCPQRRSGFQPRGPPWSVGGSLQVENRRGGGVPARS